MCYNSLLKKILGEYVKPCVLVASIQERHLLSVDFRDPSKQVSDSDLVIGIMTKQTLQKLFDGGDVSENQ